MLHYTYAIMVLYVYVGKHAWCLYVYMYVVISIFMQAGMHGYVGIYL